MNKYSRIGLAIAMLGIVIMAGLASNTTLAAPLSPSLQAKVGKIAQQIAELQARLDAQGAAALSDSLKTKQMRARIESYGAALGKMPSDDDPTLLSAQSAQAQLMNTFLQLAGSGAPAESPAVSATPTAVTSTGPQLVSGQRVRVKKLTRDISAVGAGLVTEGPSPLQSAEQVARYNAAMEKYANALKRYVDYKGDVDVIAAARAYESVRQRLADEYQRAQSQLAVLGDVQGTLAQLEALLSGSVVPQQLWSPVTQAEASRLVQARQDTKARAAQVLAEIERIAPLAYLDTNNPGTVQQGAPYDRADLRRLMSWATSNLSQADNAYTSTVNQLERQMREQQNSEISWFAQLDPDNEQHRMNAFLREGAQEEIYARLDKSRQVPQSLAAIQRASNQPVGLSVRAQLEQIESLRQQYAQNRVRAVGESRLPAAASNDATRLDIARQILAEPSYQYGTHGPIVLTTAAIDTRSQEVSRETIKEVDISLSGDLTWSGTRETWHYDWDEFKFATPIQHENGDWYVWWITAKFYRSGASTTPLNKWVSGKATQGDLILAANF